MNISFKSLESPDLQRLYEWFQEPHIKEWYANGQSFSKQDIINKYSPRVLAEEKVPCFIIHIDDEPVGFIQYYALNDFLPEGVADLSHPLFKEEAASDMAGIDLFIGDINYLDKGLGAKIIQAFLEQKLFPQFKAVVIDPAMNNIRAVKAYEKAGFLPFSLEKSDKFDETIQLMVCRKKC